MKKFLAILLTICGTLNAFCKEIVSEKERVTLIELFSSEGCSSCPPAEKQLSELTTSKDLWKKYVPVNFHVDYWNRLGWVDPYSNSKFTDRQNHYASLWSVKSIYTPAFVNNATSGGASLQLDLSGHASSLEKLPLIRLNVSNKNEVKINCENLPSGKNFEVHVALLGNDLVSNVNAGENAGKKLVQNFVVLDFQKALLMSGKGMVNLGSGGKVKPKSYAIAAWITEQDQLIPLQAVGSQL